jgi:hypothetical protein
MLEVISSTNNTLEVVKLENGEQSTYYGAYETQGLRYGNLSAQGDTNVKTVVNTLSGSKAAVGYDGSRGADQYIDGATAAQNNGYAFTDVREIKASDFKGDLTLNAILTEHVVGKYQDGGLSFEYLLGEGGDVFDLALSAANFKAEGTTTRASFTLTIDGGNGGDTISTAIFGDEYGGLTATPAKNSDPNTGIWNQGSGNDGLGLANAGEDTAWYVNSQLNANLKINAGEGNDVVNTFGAGDWTIDLGAGNDTYYSDNAEKQKATWVFNTADQDDAAKRNLDDLESDAAFAEYDVTATGGTATVENGYLISGLKVQVSFKDVKDNAPGDKGVFQSAWVDVVPFKDGVWVTDLEINQAIMTAINGDAVLKELLVATVGNGNTLVVTAKSDGQHIETDLAVSFAAPTITATSNEGKAILEVLRKIDSNITDIGSSQADALEAISGATDGPYTTITNGVPDEINVAADDFQYDAKFGTKGVADTEVDGNHSIYISNSVIYAGAGSDVIVLSTGSDSHETIVWEGIYDHGGETIVNFAPEDVTPLEYFGEVFSVGLGSVSFGGGNSSENVTFTYTTGQTAGLSASFAVSSVDTTNGIAAIGNALAAAATTAATGWNVTYNAVDNALLFTQTDQHADEPTVSVITITASTSIVTNSTPTINTLKEAVLVGGAGDDVLDFSDYGAKWLGVGTKTKDGNVDIVETWAVDDGTLGNDTVDTAVTVTQATGFATLEKGQQYITLTRANNKTTVYTVELWTAKGTDADAYVKGYTDVATKDTEVKLIGTVDLGQVFEDAELVDNILF